MNSENKSLIEKYCQRLRSANICIFSEIETLFYVLPHLLSVDYSHSTEPIVSYLLMIMMEQKESQTLLDAFIEYIVEYTKTQYDEEKRKEILSDLAQSMLSYRSLSLFYFVDSYCRTSVIKKLCEYTDLLRKNGIELYNYISDELSK